MSKPTHEVALRAAGMVWLGLPRAVIAEQLGVTQDQIRSWTRADWWPDVVAQAQSQHLDRLVGTARRVLDVTMKSALVEGATARDRKNALDAARFVLERQDKAFGPPALKVETSHTHTHTLAENLSRLSVDELRALASRPVEAYALPSSQSSGEVVDVDFEELVPDLAPEVPTRVQAGDDGRFYLTEE